MAADSLTTVTDFPAESFILMEQDRISFKIFSAEALFILSFPIRNQHDKIKTGSKIMGFEINENRNSFIRFSDEISAKERKK
jgi:hypothetical protein